MSADPFSPHIEVVARHLWGDPNPRLSTSKELRWGSHGARSVDLEKGVWFDNEQNVGGGVLDLVTREAGCKNGDAARWLRDIGIDIPDDRAVQRRRVVGAYDYRDESGDLLFQVVRYEPKDFRQRRPDVSAPDGWSWSVRGVRQVPYRLAELIEAVALGGTIFVVEGEKDVDALAAQQVPATCNAGGAGKWAPDLNEHFRGADVVVVPDNDPAGRNHADVVGAALSGIAERVRVLELPGLPPKEDVNWWLRHGGSGVELYAQAEKLGRPWGAKRPESRFGAVLWSGLDAVVMRHDWLVEDMMFTGDFALNYGASQSGKSFLAVDMGLSVARGCPFLGKATRQGAVIYQAGEGGKGLIPRLKAYRAYHGLTRDLPFVLLPSRVDLFGGDEENGIEPFLAELTAWKAWLSDPLALVVVDTWATATPGANENASEDVSRALRAIQRIQDATSAAVLVVHHKNAAGEKPRGHTSLYANADTALEVIRDPDRPKERTLRVAKVKDGEDGERLGFKLQPLEIGTYDSGKPMTSCVVVPAEVGEPGAGKYRLSPGPFRFLKLLEDAIIHRGGILPVQDDRIPHNMQGVDWTQFRDLYVAVAGPDQSAEATRQALKRDGDKLLSLGVINRHGHWIWITDKGRARL